MISHYTAYLEADAPLVQAGYPVDCFSEADPSFFQTLSFASSSSTGEA